MYDGGEAVYPGGLDAATEQRAELVTHHLWVLWTDYFKSPHFEKDPHSHQLFNDATKLAGASGSKGIDGSDERGTTRPEDRRNRGGIQGNQAGPHLDPRSRPGHHHPL